MKPFFYFSFAHHLHTIFKRNADIVRDSVIESAKLPEQGINSDEILETALYSKFWEDGCVIY